MVHSIFLNRKFEIHDTWNGKEYQSTTIILGSPVKDYEIEYIVKYK